MAGTAWRPGVVRGGLLLGLAVLAALCQAGPVHAAFTACNKTSYVLETAIGFETKGRFVSRGWYRIEPGQCSGLIEGNLTNRLYYTYAHSLPVHEGNMRYFVGNEAFCAGNGSADFNIEGKDDCERRGFISVNFAKVDVQGRADWTTTYMEGADYTLEEARVAGVQRLLRDIGAITTPVDGVLGGRTIRAVNEFKKRHGLPDDKALPSALYAALIKEARAMPRGAGFKFCNETDYVVWGAVAYEEGNDPLSTGWFKIPARGCRVAIKTRLVGKTYYAYAEADRQSGGILIWGGPEAFCTTEEPFTIRGRTNCEKRGYVRTGFMRVESNGTAEIIQTLTSDGASTRRGASR